MIKRGWTERGREGREKTIDPRVSHALSAERAERAGEECGNDRMGEGEEREVVDEEAEYTKRHTTDGVIGSWEISRSLFLEGVSADAEVSIMME